MAAVGITGAMAFGANVGLLNAASGSKGSVVAQPATTDVTNTTIVDVYVTDPAGTTASTTAGNSTGAAASQQYQVGPAGVVTLEQDASHLKLAAVNAAKGYTWNSLQPTPTQVVVNILNGSKRYQFRASIDTTGSVKVAVTDVTPAPNQPPAGGGGEGDDDGGESDD